MKTLLSLSSSQAFNRLPALLATLLLGTGTITQATAKSVSKWEVFEDDFRSTRTYENPVQQARLTVDFVSPSGRTNRVHGFWNDGTRWAVRFSPDELGRWTYTTECSDSRNSGLHGQSGKFLCTVQSLRNDLQRHGKIRVPAGSLTFQHADGTPFFWAADGVWEGARKSTRKEWDRYVSMRSGQGFNVALWRAAPGTDERGKSVFEGREEIQVDHGVLRRLDEKIAWLNESGMASAISPLWEIGMSDDDLLPEDQVIVLLRQLVGRWDAYHVAWIIAFEADTGGRRAARWRRIARSVFDRVHHSPVILCCGSTHWALKEFSSESWVSAVAFQSGNDVSEGAGMWLARGPITTLWKQQPIRPVLNLLPAVEGGLAADGQHISTPQAVEAMARSLFISAPAGVCYQSRATAEWDQTVDTSTTAVTGEAMTEWQKSLYLPGATRVSQIHELLEQAEFDRLLPTSSLLSGSPEGKSAARPLSALVTPRRDRAVVFVPEGETASIGPRALRTAVEATFFSLRTGLESPTASPSGDRISEFPVPGPGDWLLFLAPMRE